MTPELSHLCFDFFGFGCYCCLFVFLAWFPCFRILLLLLCMCVCVWVVGYRTLREVPEVSDHLLKLQV